MTSPTRTLAWAAAAGALVCGALSHAYQEPPRFRRELLRPRSLQELREADQRIDSLERTGQLRVRRVQEDTLIADREHERLDQYYRGVRIWGGDVTRQVRANGQTVSTFGTLYENVDIDPSPEIDAATARAVVAGRNAGGAVSTQPELVVLPRADGTFTLAWRIRAVAGGALDVREYFVDANTGAVVLDYSDLQTQTGVIGLRGVRDQSRGPAVASHATRQRGLVSNLQGDSLARSAAVSGWRLVFRPLVSDPSWTGSHAAGNGHLAGRPACRRRGGASR